MSMNLYRETVDGRYAAMNEYLIAYTGPRGGKPKYDTIQANTAREAAEKFIDRTEKTYVVGVYEPVEWRG
jgi:hypothetical protein